MVEHELTAECWCRPRVEVVKCRPYWLWFARRGNVWRHMLFLVIGFHWTPRKAWRAICRANRDYWEFVHYG